MQQLQSGNAVGGWAEYLKNNINVENEKVILNAIEIVTADHTRSIGKRRFIDVRADILKTLIDCRQNRFPLDKDLIDIVQPFIKFAKEADIRQIHKIFGADLSLANLNFEYMELVQLKICNELSLIDEIKQLILHNDSSKYDCILIILCRIKACTPQSADTERAIKANNLIKTAFRTRLNLDTENKYMYVYFNMPALKKWDPRKAVGAWLNEKSHRNHNDLIQKDTAKA